MNEISESPWDNDDFDDSGCNDDFDDYDDHGCNDADCDDVLLWFCDCGSVSEYPFSCESFGVTFAHYVDWEGDSCH